MADIKFTSKEHENFLKQCYRSPVTATAITGHFFIVLVFQITLYRKLALLIPEKLTDPKFRINKLDNCISKIFPVVALIRKFFRKH